MILSLSLWGQEEKIPMDFPCEDCTTEEGLIKELVGEGYFDFSDVEAIAISDQSYSNIAGEGKKVNLTVKTAEDGSTTEIIELTDDLNELIGGFTSSGEGTAEATIHYVTDENCAATLLELKSPIKGSPRRIADYTEDIYIIDLNGDGLDVKILSNFAFSETFTNQVSGFNPIYARNKAPLGEWTKKLLLRGFKKVTTFVASKSPWSIAINVVASYAIGGMIEYWVGDHENVPEAFFAHVIKEGFRGALANLVDAYGEGLAASVITATISYIIKTPFDQFDAQQMILQVAVGTVLNLITTSKNVERLRSVVGNVTTFTKDLIRVPSLIPSFLGNKKLVESWGVTFSSAVIRKNIANLEIVVEFLVKYPTRKNDFKSVFNSLEFHPSDIEKEDFLNSVKIFNSISQINSTETLLNVLRSVRSVNRVADLEEKGIDKFFRGTNIDNNGNLFPGNPNTIANGTSSSTDPIVATIFGIQAKTDFGGSGILVIAKSQNLGNTKLVPPNRRVDLEREVIMDITPTNFYDIKDIEISVSDARRFIKEITGFDLDSNISLSTSNQVLNDAPRMTQQQIEEFYQKALEL